MEYNLLMSKMMKYFLICVLVMPVMVEAKIVEYCTSVAGAVAKVKLVNLSLAGGEMDPPELDLINESCFYDDASENTVIIKKHDLLVNGKTVETPVKYMGESTPYRIKIRYADAYIDGQLIIGNILLFEETPISESEYQAAKAKAKAKKSRREALNSAL